MPYYATLKNALVFALYVQFSSADPAFVKPPKNVPDGPEAPPIRPPVPPPVVVGSPGSGSRVSGEEAQVGIQYKMGNLERKLKPVEEGIGALTDIVSAVLENVDCSPPTRIGQDAKTCDAEFTPTASVPVESFAACSSFAQIISSCATATTSFYSLDATAQASCACYSTPATRSAGGPVCTGTKQAQVTAAPTLAISDFDGKAASCFSYFSAQGYNNIAAVLGGSNNQSLPTGSAGSQAVLGTGFCKKVNDGAKSSNGSVGLDPSLRNIVWTDCAGLVGGSESNQVTNAAGVALNDFDRGAMLVFTVFVTLLSVFVFG
ncbi:unnamed protein product [Periconia digitata]|uniref:Uncharacterized protein n=1 Tax=Periconia digitata TaxID=1303443 RepID=A0A9W4U2T1_9PLEO|nr:unnamed protein product [Periconia digitata]